MPVKLTIEVPDAEFARMLADALAGGNDRAEQVIADAGMTRGAPQSAPSAPMADPWDDAPDDVPPASSPATQARSAPRAQTITVTTAKGRQQWTLGADRAPDCLCGEAAAYVVGATNGKTWKRWACSKGSGDDWRNKCDFSEWVR